MRGDMPKGPGSHASVFDHRRARQEVRQPAVQSHVGRHLLVFPFQWTHGDQPQNDHSHHFGMLLLIIRVVQVSAGKTSTGCVRKQHSDMES